MSELIPAPKSEIWEALTQVEKMRQWYFENIPAFKAKVGFNLSSVNSLGLIPLVNSEFRL